MGVSFCLARHPEHPTARCDLEPRHEGEHFTRLPSGPLTWPNESKKPKPRKPRAPMQRGKGPRQESVKHKLLNAKWAGIKEDRLYMMTMYDPSGPHCESCGVKGNARTLDLHHVRSRAQGGSYDARNGMLLCNRFSKNGPENCHDRETGKPQWSQAS